jgi:hypothetical protein
VAVVVAAVVRVQLELAQLAAAHLVAEHLDLAPDQAEAPIQAVQALQVVLTPVKTIPPRQAAVSIPSPLVREAWRPILPPGNPTIPETSTIRTTPPIPTVRHADSCGPRVKARGFCE